MLNSIIRNKYALQAILKKKDFFYKNRDNFGNIKEVIYKASNNILKKMRDWGKEWNF